MLLYKGIRRLGGCSGFMQHGGVGVVVRDRLRHRLAVHFVRSVWNTNTVTVTSRQSGQKSSEIDTATNS